MKRISPLMIGIFMMLVLIPTSTLAYTGNDVTVVDLIAGQHMDAGEIKIWNDSDNLYVKYIAATDWCLEETHLQVASSLDGIPQVNGNPIPGQFEYQNTGSCAPKFTYAIPLTGDSCDLYIAAHAVVKNKKGPTETAWGSGIDFPGDNWATYFKYSIDGCVVPHSSLSLTKTASASTYSEIDQLITYTYVIENTGNVALTGPFSVTDDKVSVSCEQPTDGKLSPREKMSCSARYSITQADIDAGSVTNTASASGGGVTSPEVSATITAFVLNPSLSLVKEGILDLTVVEPNDQVDVGDVINYKLTATNDGNVTLSKVTISDPLVDMLSCNPVQPTSLTPGGTIVCTGSYKVSQIDIDNGSVKNTAVVVSDKTLPVHDTNVTFVLRPFPHIRLEKGTTTTSYDQVGQVIDYMLIARNDGNVALTDVTISDPLIGALDCVQPVTLDPGEALTCTGSHTVTQADIDAGSIVNTAMVAGTDPDNNSITGEASKTVSVGGICQPTIVVADFSQVAVGESVEGLGKVAPYLNIDAKGTAVKIVEGLSPRLYGAPNDVVVGNGGLVAGGGFSDFETQQAVQAHRYVFTFSGGSVSDFSLRMLDYGDWNVPKDAAHYVSMVAYDGSGVEVARQELRFTSPEVSLPRSSDIYGDLYITGDAVTASPGQPGNWTWNVSGSGITEIVLEFGVGFDPNIGFDTLSFTTECVQ
jgi:uncharacterized repeat protein (TIGR01451 family)